MSKICVNNEILKKIKILNNYFYKILMFFKKIFNFIKIFNKIKFNLNFIFLNFIIL